ncbi:hypothetical protein DW198_15970 [Bacteroides fragilis]|nr:hypothetical protein DW198_15970 [Bacteroides fragilis]
MTFKGFKVIFEVPGEPLFLYFPFLSDKEENLYISKDQNFISFTKKIKENKIKVCSTNVVPK